MYGYSVSGVETAGSAFANLTGFPIPNGYRESIIPSLLFGSLISATDPGTCTWNINTSMTLYKYLDVHTVKEFFGGLEEGC